MMISVLLAQYGGGAPAVGQVLGESTPSGIPGSLVAGALVVSSLAIAGFFFFFKNR